MSATPDITLANPDQRIADLERQLAAREAELAEAQEQQTATAEVLQVISSSQGDLAPVFDAMLEKAMRLCEAAFGFMMIYDGDQFRPRAQRGVPPPLAEYLAAGPDRPGPGEAHTRVLAGEDIIHSLDFRAEEPYRLAAPLRRAVVDLGGARTALVIALRNGNLLLGTFTMYRQEVRPFSKKQIALLQNFAAQAVIAIENARLIDELRTYAGELARRQAELRESNERHALVTQAVAEGIYDWNISENKLWVSARLIELFGWADADAGAGERPSQDWNDRVHPQDFSTYRTALRSALKGEAPRLHCEYRIRLSNGDYRWVEDHAVPVRDDSGWAVRLVGAVSDITDRKRGEEELREALEQQTATAEVLQVINANPGDLAPVFDAMLERAMRLCDAAFGIINTFDGNEFHPVAYNGVPAAFADLLRSNPPQPGPENALSRLAGGEKLVQMDDMSAAPGYRLGDPRARVELGGARSYVIVPLRKDGLLLGTLAAYRKEVRPFSGKQIALLQNFAAQAVIAMENARLFAELQDRTDELTRSIGELQALEEVLRAVNSSLDLDTVLATIISRAAQLSEADEGTIYEFDDSEQIFVPKSAFGMSEERVEALRERRIKLGETHLGRSAIERAPVYVSDVQQDPTVPHAGRTLPGIHAVLAVPLLREDKVVGGLVIRRRSETGFAPTIVALMQTFAGQAVIAIENARLFQELAARGEEARRAHAAAEAALADLRSTQDRLIQSEKMASLGQLTAGIAHEIKNPLNFINNFAGLSIELLGELKATAAPAFAGLAEDERADIDEIVVLLIGNLEKIAEHGRRADGIVKSMLEHSRGASGERREVDLNTLVDEALNLAYHGARAQDADFTITLERDFDPALAPIELAPQEITRVLLNLFGNGFYAATRRARGKCEADYRPTLRVSTRDLENAVEVRVRDNGVGIAPGIRDRLFQPFFTTKPTGEGTGLGLSISYDIVTQQHGGSIEVDSRVGDFTEFTVRLPHAPSLCRATNPPFLRTVRMNAFA
jgi:two-component system, NtrC family, sensor kinase